MGIVAPKETDVLELGHEQGASTALAPTLFITVYDWDDLIVSKNTSLSLNVTINLCLGILPCFLSIKGGLGKNGYVTVTNSGSIVCSTSIGCASVQFEHINLNCSGEWRQNSVIVLDGAVSTITDSTFSGCTSSRRGTALNVQNGAQLTVINSTFEMLCSFDCGGAISILQASASLLDSRFLLCSSTQGGGAIFISGVNSGLEVASTFFSNGSSQSDGGSIQAVEGAVVSIGSSSFENTFSLGSGGAIRSTGGQLSVSDTLFFNISAVLGGGGICANGISQQVLVQGSLFRHCGARGQGGGIQIFDGATLYVNNSRFLEARSTGSGGGISSINAFLALSGSVFNRCSTQSGGGAIQASGTSSELSILRSVFMMCSANEDGGSILAFDGVDVRISNTDFQLSECGGLGGAISMAGASIKLHRSSFSNCTASSGGGIFVGSSQQIYDDLTNTIEISDSMFELCFSSAYGGAITVTDKSNRLSLAKSNFTACSSNAGGAVFVELAATSVEDCIFIRNSAFGGGGGALLWSGIEPPRIIQSTSLCPVQSPWMCCIQNSAVYGDCVASTYYSLSIHGIPTVQHPAFPGIPFNISVIKKDFYNQTIISDSSSIVEAISVVGEHLESNSQVALSGISVTHLVLGFAELNIIIRPTLSFLDAELESVAFISSPNIYIKGIDAENTNIEMQSNILPIALANGSNICPGGYVLQFDIAKSSSCDLCLEGTYSINPLAAVAGGQHPSCLPCPAGMLCTGGNRVQFLIGTWVIEENKYILIGCPQGHQLINTDIDGIFAYYAQTCYSCKQSQYILDSNNSMFACQNCPQGEIT